MGNGNIGIGTTTPQVKLDVYGTTPQIRALDSGSGVDMRMASNIYVGTGTVGTLSNHPVNMVSNNVVRLFITADGKIGVGNVNPAYQLDVQGSIKTRNGFVFPDNSTQTTASFGTVTTVNTGAGLTGGPITTSGTISLAAPSWGTGGSGLTVGSYMVAGAWTGTTPAGNGNPGDTYTGIYTLVTDSVGGGESGPSNVTRTDQQLPGTWLMLSKFYIGSPYLMNFAGFFVRVA